MTTECPKCHTNNPDTLKFCSECGTQLASSEDARPSLTKTLETPSRGLNPGSIFAIKYNIVNELGKGGMGVVYKAKDTKLKRTVALKFLSPNLIGDKEAMARFLREAQTAATLDHPNICTIYEVDEADDKAFISMAYIDGQNLRDRIKTNPPDINTALDFSIQITDGLSAAHKHGIVHRDIKSANIMVTKEGQAKIMDFGLAKFSGASMITREGSTMGTVAYMSPEQAQGKAVDHRSDIWSLGIVLYEMFSGNLPFQGETEASFLYSIVHEEPKALKNVNPDVPVEIQKIINRTLKKKPESRYQTTDEMLSDLKQYVELIRTEESGVLSLRTVFRRIRQPRIAIPAILILLIITSAFVWFLNRQAKIRWAKQEALPEIERLIENNFRDFTEAYRLAEKAEINIPNDPQLAEFFSKCSLNINIKTEPSGADIYMKEYKAPDSEWEYSGVSPIENIRVPIGIFRWKLEKQGYETVLATSSTWNATMEGLIPYDLVRVLDDKSSIPEGMVRVTGAETEMGKYDDFFIDKYEVTNKQYKEFVDTGGYRNRDYWKHEFLKDGKVLTWKEAAAELVDQTGRPGPATWQAGDYPEGQENNPVSGISWYEAAAYTEFSGKALPTESHWGIAMGEYTPMIQWPQFGGFAIFAPFSNFQSEGSVPVGSLQGITSYGAHDMAGNTREWCFNETQQGRLIRGGAWNDNSYMFKHLSQAPAFDRSPQNGFRCAVYPDPENFPESAFQMTQYKEAPDYYKEKPVSDAIFQIYKEQFSYDKTELNARVESTDESSADWIQERITFDAAYGGERIIGVLFLPKNIKPPHQTVVYFPGVQAIFRNSSKDLESSQEFKVFLSFILKNGRAVLYPVYKGTMERQENALIPIALGYNNNSYQFTEYLIQIVKDLKRCIDYLEIRQDIDSSKLAYLGMSWGGWFGAIIPAVEDRFKTSVMLAGGFDWLEDRPRPEARQFNYVTRVKTPTLMLNGKYDSIFSYEKSVKPMFDLLGTPDEHKKLKLFESDHIPPRNEFIKETLAWLDRYLGPVNR